MAQRMQAEWRRGRGFLTRFVLLAGLLFTSNACTTVRVDEDVRTDEDCALISATFWETARIDRVESCIAAGAGIDARGEADTTPLHLAVVFGTAETVIALVDAGANIEARSGNGQTPLHQAALQGMAETVTALVKAGANIGARTTEGGLTPLHLAAVSGTAETVTALITAGANIEARNEHGLTPLHGAAAFGTAETVTTLVAAGANITARNNDGKLPADLAEDNSDVRESPAFRILKDGRF